MIYLTAALGTIALIPAIVFLAAAFGYDSVEVTYHPPIFVKIKLGRSQRRH